MLLQYVTVCLTCQISFVNLVMMLSSVKLITRAWSRPLFLHQLKYRGKHVNVIFKILVKFLLKLEMEMNAII